MIITNLQILNPQFIPALEKLLKKDMPVSTCEALAIVISEIEKKANILQKVRTAVVDKYLEKNDKGQPIIINGNQPKYKSPEAQQQFLTEINGLLQENFEVSFDKKIDVPEDEVMNAQEYMLVRDLINIIKKSTGAIDINK